MACEPVGINYLGSKKQLLRDSVWPIVSRAPSLQKIGVAVFQKFSLKKSCCIQMLRFGVVDWLLKLLVDLQP